MELLRKSAISTVGIPHKMTKDVVYQGFLFPKDTTVISYIYRVLRDPNVWGDPENFRPERFLSPDGTKVVKHDALIPFSIGKRQVHKEAYCAYVCQFYTIKYNIILSIFSVLEKLLRRIPSFSS